MMIRRSRSRSDRHGKGTDAQQQGKEKTQGGLEQEEEGRAGASGFGSGIPGDIRGQEKLIARLGERRKQSRHSGARP
jgi:hypothetical protein